MNSNSLFTIKSPGVSHKMGVFIILLSFHAFARGETTILTVVEGDYTQLNFSYPCDSARVTLRNGMRAPFYDSANSGSLSLAENQELKFQYETDTSNCLLQLKLKTVLRSDAGGYILTAYDGDGNILEDTRVGLRVDYPPGKASCEWAGENVVNEWGYMRCKAPAGSMPGQIACYQNGIRVPPVTAPTEVRDILQQTIWVRYPQNAFCCASLQDQPINICTCDDFVWDPLQNGNINTDPCTAPRQDSTSPQSPKEDNIYSPTIAILSRVKETITEKPVKNNVTISLHWVVLIIIVSFVLLNVVLAVVLIVACRKFGEGTEHKNIKDKQRSVYLSVSSVEGQL